MERTQCGERIPRSRDFGPGIVDVPASPRASLSDARRKRARTSSSALPDSVNAAIASSNVRKASSYSTSQAEDLGLDAPPKRAKRRRFGKLARSPTARLASEAASSRRPARRKASAAQPRIRLRDDAVLGILHQRHVLLVPVAAPSSSRRAASPHSPTACSAQADSTSWSSLLRARPAALGVIARRVVIAQVRRDDREHRIEPGREPVFADLLAQLQAPPRACLRRRSSPLPCSACTVANPAQATRASEPLFAPNSRSRSRVGERVVPKAAAGRILGQELVAVGDRVRKILALAHTRCSCAPSDRFRRTPAGAGWRRPGTNR